MPRYNPAEIEPRWQAYWEQNARLRLRSFRRARSATSWTCFPIPAGTVCTSVTPKATQRPTLSPASLALRGESVLHPMGFDAFGLPAEEHAIKTGEHPRIQTQRNIDNFTRQLKMLGFSYDWDRVWRRPTKNTFAGRSGSFLVLYDTWFDAEQQRGRPIAELPIPADGQLSRRMMRSQLYRDSKPFGLPGRRAGQLVSRAWARYWPTKKFKTARVERGRSSGQANSAAPVDVADHRRMPNAC